MTDTDNYEMAPAPLPKGITTEALAEEVDRMRMSWHNDRHSRHTHNKKIIAALDEVRANVMEQEMTTRQMVTTLVTRMDRFEIALMGGGGARGLSDQLRDLSGAVGEVARALAEIRTELKDHRHASQLFQMSIQGQVDALAKDQNDHKSEGEKPTAWTKAKDSAIAWVVPVVFGVGILIVIKLDVAAMLAKAAGVAP